MPFKNIILRLLEDDSGASAIEYGLVLALISIGLIASARGVALQLNDVWTKVDTSMVGAAS